MGRLKTFRKYIIWIIAFYIFTMICTYVGLNVTYKNIEILEKLPEQVKINLAQSTKVNGRILGEVTSTENNDLNGKYIKVQIYTKKGNLAGTKYLKIENTKINEPKKFAVYFTAENIENYTVDIIEDGETLEHDITENLKLYEGTFTEQDMKVYTRLIILFGLSYIL